MDANLRLRIATASVLIPGLILLIGWSPPWLFTAILFIITAGALHEYFAMVFPQRWAEQGLGVFFGLALSASIFFDRSLELAPWLGTLFLGVFAIYMLFPGALNERLNRLLFTLLGGIYGGFLLPHWILVFQHQRGRAWVFWVLGVVMTGDTAAYLVGRRLGVRRLAPQISPGKTVAGAWAYLGGGVAAGLVGAMLLFDGFNWIEISVLAVLICILGQLGDLFESWLKRVFAVKDSSGLLPGHGGLLDRLDSLIFPAVFTSAYLKVFHL